jgi:hypothetical protein
MMPERADATRVFYISSPDVLGLTGFSDRKETLYSFNDLKSSLTQIEEQSRLATQAQSETRNPFQRDILKLREALLLYVRLKNSVQPEASLVSFFGPDVIPAADVAHSRTAGSY